MADMNLDKRKVIGLKNKIRSFFSTEFSKNYIVRWLIILNVFLNIMNWAMLAIFVKPVDFPIVLHYNVYFGVDQIGDWKQAYLAPAIGAVIFLVNFFLAFSFFRQKERIAAYIIFLASLMVQIGLIIASSSLIIVNY